MISQIAKLMTLVAFALLVFAGTANAVDLLGYYEFEGNFNDSAGPIGPAAPGQNPGEVSFVGGGFRGAAVDINDPAASGGGNSGGTVDVPYNASPPAFGPATEVTFGGWFNLQTNNGFTGAVAIDNGGWDRGVQMQNNWGIASGGNLNNIAPTTVGQWQYVMATFSKNTNQATLYVGDANPLNQTTASGTRADGQNTAGLPVIEIGRYDNQDLDALVDDFTVWNEALTADEANAVRNLRLNPTLDYSPADAELLFDAFDASGSATVGSTNWTFGAVGGSLPGELLDLGGGNFELRLNNAGGLGLIGAAAVPEPSTFALALLGLLLLGGRRLRRRS